VKARANEAARAIARTEEFLGGPKVVGTFNNNDPAYPPNESYCGRFLAVKFAADPRDPMTFTDIKIDRAHQNKSFLTFDPRLPGNKTPVFIVTPPEVRRKALAELFDTSALCTFHEAAQQAGGRHKDDCLNPLWPDGARRLIVCPLGTVIAVTYFANKFNNGPSNYIHKLGEETGVRPILCVDGQGRFWWAGGNYTVTPDGLAD